MGSSDAYQTLLAGAYAWTYIDNWFTSWLKHSSSLEGIPREDLVAALAAAHRIHDLTIRQGSMFTLKVAPGPVDG